MPIGRSLCFFAVALAAVGAIAAPQLAPPAGLRENTPAVHALVDARIVVAPGKVIDKGTIVIRDGVIVAAGADLSPPADARVWKLNGKTVYAGFIDAYGELPADAARPAATYWNGNVTPEMRAERVYAADAATNKKLRGQGITTRLVAPAVGLVKGTSALVSTGDGSASDAIVSDQVAMHLKLTPGRGGPREERGGYPNSPMGALTLVRQAFYDAGWYGQAWDAYEQNKGLERPERSDALAALRGFLGSQHPVIVDGLDELYALRADRMGKEFGLNVIIRGSGNEYRRLELIQATRRAVIVPLDFPRPPKVSPPEVARNVSLERLMSWDLAPENPGRLANAAVRIAFTTQGLRDQGGFLAAIRKAVKRGLKPEAALAALTTTPCELFGVAKRLGTIEERKTANLVVTDGDLFDAKTKVAETWVDGVRYEIEAPPPVDVRGTWELNVTNTDGSTEVLTLQLAGEPAKLSGRLARGEKETALDRVAVDENQFAASVKGKELKYEGVVQISGTLSTGPQTAPVPPSTKPIELTWLGVVVWADGSQSVCEAKRTDAAVPKLKPRKETDKNKSDDKSPEGDKKSENKAESEEDDKEPPKLADKGTKPEIDKQADAEPTKRDDKKPDEPRSALFAVNYPLGDYGVEKQPDQPKAVVFRNVAVWTCGAQGLLENAVVLVENGKIAAVGHDLRVPADALIIDGEGKHLSPGVIDCHSHMATDGGVNESGQTITAEVRIADFIDPNDINIYRQLAGGVTSSNILHGSANTIGGQNQVIKLRWGAGPEELKFASAPQGIKFALGENVKQSNWERATGRYPQTRMGVEQLVRDAFDSAIDYRRRWDEWQRQKTGLPPRVDLELEALSEIVAGKRLIHCHSYRQDEILALLRTCEAYNVRIATLQHILEGYKVADAIARHGAGGSSFSDWWAYKFEVYDAIPHNGALMHDAGVVVSFNSDDAELARRLNLEAGKAVKYGGVPPIEALKFVTLNPAKQLDIDRWVGSIEPGKDADLVLWSGPPMSTLSRCEQTWIDGRRYFDREEDRQRRGEVAKRHAALVQRVLASGEPGGDDDRPRENWPREDIFCHAHDHGHGDHHHDHSEGAQR